MTNHLSKQLHPINGHNIPIYRMTKTGMVDKVKEKHLQVTSIFSVEETHLSLDKDKWLLVTSKNYKTQI